ncbi:MAG: hypothetical protein B7Z66_07790 [Chromatiales bacterium 21-64-14]|nr:MAG: hypothetical protein B7Z66_07790 [Chromatiales bacterium 21-64-14]HQU15956.1 efflux RND transporter permease subunit [Gammaproteobacteria bacterium]
MGGAASCRALPVDLFLNTNYPLTDVVTHHPAGTSRDMTLPVTRPIKHTMAGLHPLRRVRLVSAPGLPIFGADGNDRLRHVTLVSVTVNNGIVPLSCAGQPRRAGLDAATAIHRAVEVRIRPLLRTHLTSILALVPAALGTGAFLILNLIPVLYVATERWRRPPRTAADRDGDPA